MNHEVEAFVGELKALREKVAFLDKIFRYSFAPDKYGDIYFICGEGGEKDKNNLPERIHICPAYGVDWFQIYEKTNQTEGPEW
jgi:hypothetical protein